MQLKEELEMLEEERSRIARDLHDDLGPVLSLARIHLSRLEVAFPEEIGHVKRLHLFLDEMGVKFSENIRNLGSQRLVNVGLERALSLFLDKCQDSGSVFIEFEYSLNLSLDLSTSMHLYRIIQELTHNAIRHAEAEEIQVELRQVRKRIHLFFKDDGKGLPQDQKPAEGIGRSNLDKRVQLLGGTMRLWSEPGKGTKYFIDIPLNNNYDKTYQSNDRR